MSPEVTLQRITPHLARWGITRLADVTGLDALGISTCCAIRPAATTLQVSNGKGLRLVDAKVSALMESMELAHLEAPPARPLMVASVRQLQAQGEPWAFETPAYMPPNVASDDSPLEWVRGTELCSGASLWLPASAAWERPAQVFAVSSHGLASGNTLTEATLHALYEVLERHALAWLENDGKFSLDAAFVFDASEAPDADVRALAARVAQARAKLILLRVDAPLDLHAFMAVLLDRESLGAGSVVNVGSGAHLSPFVAATRAITEAAQSRLAFIHGAREDLRAQSYERSAVHDRLLDFFAGVEPDTDWAEVTDSSTESLDDDLASVLAAMNRHGLNRAFRIDLSFAELPFCVVKTIVPGSRRFKTFHR